MPTPSGGIAAYIADYIASNLAGSLLGAAGGFFSGASIDMDFQNGNYLGRTPADLTVVRASSKTNLFPTSVSGFAYSTFLSNVAAITPGSGLSVEEARTNVLLNSTAPVTQTTASLGTGVYTLWVNGSGSATSSAGSATVTGAGAATNGTPNVFTVTVAGTVTITVGGSLNAFQCELGTFGTSFIITAGATATRATDVISLTSAPTFGTAYSLFGRGTPQAPDAFATPQRILDINDGTVANAATLARTATAQPLTTLTGGTGGNIIPTGPWSQNVSGKLALAVTASDQAAVFNAGTPATAALAVLPTTPTQVYIGNRPDAVRSFNGFIQRVALWPITRIPNAQLQAITT